MDKLQTQLKIFRGTYLEIMALPTHDMEWYLSWDTQEFFVGSPNGIKTPYLGGKNLTEREVTDMVNALISGQFEIVNGTTATIISDLNIIRDQIIAMGVIDVDLENRLAVLEEKIDSIENAINQAVSDYLSVNGSDLFYTKQETLTQIETYTYEKQEIDIKVDQLVSNSNLTAFEESFNKYKTIEDLVELDEILNEISISEQDLLTTISSTVDGIFKIKTILNGYELLIKNSSFIVRIPSDGYFYKLVNQNWEQIREEIDLSEYSNLILSADNITDSASRIWNSILPDNNGAINPSGRLAGEDIGGNSIAIGNQSVALETESIAIGAFAVANTTNSVQLGQGINNTADTLQFRDITVINENGKLPVERLSGLFHTSSISIAVSDWDLNTKEAQVTVSGITNTSIIFTSPAESSFLEFINSQVRAISQSQDTITFKCSIIPEFTVYVNLVYMELI